MYRDMSRIYLVPLTKDTPSPFEPKSDEVAVDGEDEEKEQDKDKEEDVEVQVDADGITGRIVGLPIEAANYRALTGVDNRLYYMRNGMKKRGLPEGIKYYKCLSVLSD